MRTVRLTSADGELFHQAMKLYEVSFPYHEQREAPSQCAILLHEEYHFELLYDEECFVGILLYWETANFQYVEHFCIEPLLRNRCYGQRALALLQEKGKAILLEIDPPVDTIARKRRAFYQRAGFCANPYDHVHPPYHPGCEGHHLVIMSHPGVLNEQAYEEFRAYLEHTVMDWSM